MKTQEKVLRVLSGEHIVFSKQGAIAGVDQMIGETEVEVTAHDARDDT